MEGIFRKRFTWTYLLGMICLVHISHQTTSGELEDRILKLETMLQTSPSAVEVRIQTLENLIMNKLSDMGADSIKAFEKRFKKMETIVMNKLSVCGSASESSSIDELKEQGDAIGEYIRLMKKDMTRFDGKLENILSGSDSAGRIQNLQLDNLDRQIKEGLGLLKHVQESVTQEKVNTANHEENKDLSIGLEIIEKQIKQSSESLSLIIEEIKLLKTDGVLNNNRLNTLSLDINNLTINTNGMSSKAENIEKQMNQSAELISVIIEEIKVMNISESVQSITHLHCTDGFFRLSHSLGSESFCLGVTENLSWDDARRYCQGRDGDLAQPSNPAVLGTYIKDKGFPGSFWVGGTDAGSEGDWTWINGSPIPADHAYWAPDEPNSYSGNEDCLLLYTASLPNGLYDGRCTAARKFICEK